MVYTATTPSDVAPAASPESSFDDKLGSLLFGEDGPAEGDSGADAPTADAAPDAGGGEPEVDILPEDEHAPAPSGELELIHNGQKVRVSTEQARNLAQMGYDYSQKMQGVNAEKARIQQVAQALQAQGNLQAQLLDHAAVVRALDMQLQRFSGADWVRLSQEDPIGYSQSRAQYDALVEQRNGAWSNMAGAYANMQQASSFVSQETRNQEREKLLERVPEWRDPAKYGAEAAAIFSAALSEYGYTQAELQNNPVLDDHRAIAILRDAWKYRQAMAASRSKRQSGVPGVAKPGVAAARSTTDTAGLLAKQLRQTRDPAKKKAVFDALLSKKIFG